MCIDGFRRKCLLAVVCFDKMAMGGDVCEAPKSVLFSELLPNHFLFQFGSALVYTKCLTL
jgi:hypothetical protein